MEKADAADAFRKNLPRSMNAVLACMPCDSDRGGGFTSHVLRALLQERNLIPRQWVVLNTSFVRCGSPCELF